MTQFRVVFLGVEDVGRRKTRVVEAVDIRTASAKVKEISPRRDYLIVLESRYTEATLKNYAF